MKSMMASLACIGLSAALLAGCGTNNNGVTTKNVDRANVIHQGKKVIHQGSKVTQNAVNKVKNITGITGANNRNAGANRNGVSNAGRYNTLSNGATNANTKSHILQLGNWMRIVGTNGKTGVNANASPTGKKGKRGGGIASFNDQDPSHVVVKTVNDPKAIQAIDRINRILSNKTSLSSQSDTLLKDLSYVLQSAQK